MTEKIGRKYLHAFLRRGNKNSKQMHEKKYPTLKMMREMQIKNLMRFCFTLLNWEKEIW